MDQVGGELRPVYPRGCARDFDLVELGGELFVAYVTEGVGRIDRIGASGEVIEAIDLDPGIASRATYRSWFGLPPPKGKIPRLPATKHGLPDQAQPMEDIVDIEGIAADDFFVVASFNVYNTRRNTRIAHYSKGRFGPLRYLRSRWAMLFTWPEGRILSYGQDDIPNRSPVFEWAEGEGATPDLDDLIPQRLVAPAFWVMVATS